MAHIVVHSLSSIWFFVTPWTVAHQAPLFFTISWSLCRFTSIKSRMLSNHLILCCPLLLPMACGAIRFSICLIPLSISVSPRLHTTQQMMMPDFQFQASVYSNHTVNESIPLTLPAKLLKMGAIPAHVCDHISFQAAPFSVPSAPNSYLIPRISWLLCLLPKTFLDQF